MTKEKDEKQLDQVLDQLSTENLAIFMLDDEQVSIQGVIYKIKRNFKEAFQVETFKDRFVDVFFDYDYIVGDFSGNLLRLRGFYDEGRHNAALDQTITRLEDYLMESVNFGAPYFVLERAEKLEKLPIEERDFNRSSGKKSGRKKDRQRRPRKSSRRGRQVSNKNKSAKNNRTNHQAKKPAIKKIKQKENKQSSSEPKAKKVVAKQKSFKIIQKKD